MGERQAMVVLSGGQDSVTCLYWAKQNFDKVHAVTFDYEQKHARELEAARTIAQMAGVASHEVVTLGPVLTGRSPLVNPKESLEQYDNFEQMDKTIGDRVELTFVPMRNTLFLTVALNRAVCLDCYELVTGVCQADNANYPDCRETFINAYEDAAEHSLGVSPGTVTIHTPLMCNSKAETVKLALALPGCWEALAYSHTAYDGSYPPTGKDHATILRAQGFLVAGYPDPLVVRAWYEQALPELPDTGNYDRLRAAGRASFMTLQKALQFSAT